MQSVLTNAFSGLTIGILAPFLIGFIFRTCVGSATIAMVTAATMITPLIDVLGFSSPMGPRHRHAGLRCRRHDGLPWQR